MSERAPRRLKDLAAVLPVAGLAFMMLPLIWSGAALAVVLAWLLGAWLAIVLAALVLGRALGRH